MALPAEKPVSNLSAQRGFCAESYAMSSTTGFDFEAASDAAMAGLNTLWAKPKRSHSILLSAGAGVLFVAFLSLVLSGRAAVLVLDKPSQHFLYPFTIQNFMHIVFFVGLGDLFVRWRIATRASEIAVARAMIFSTSACVIGSPPEALTLVL